MLVIKKNVSENKYIKTRAITKDSKTKYITFNIDLK